MRRLFLFLIIFTVAILCFYFLYSQERLYESPKAEEYNIQEAEAEKTEEDKNEQELRKQIPESRLPFQVNLSSEILEQGDTVLIQIKNREDMDQVSGELGGDKISFLKSESGNWIGIVGVDAKQSPGKYNLVINLPKEEFRKEITVVKRNFPVTELVVTEELEKKGYTPSTIEESIETKDNPSMYEIFEIYTPTTYFDKPFNYPLEKIEVVGAYGNIRKTEDIELQHLGVDLDAEENTPVLAINDGVVRFTEDLVNYGKTVIIDHGLGIFSVYLHLNKFQVSVGDVMERGDIIGLSGDTGYSIAPHLHFSVKLNNIKSMTSVDPLRFIETTKKF